MFAPVARTSDPEAYTELVKRLFPYAPVPLLLLAVACVTVNVYFPEGEIRDLSRQIEEEIRQQAAEEAAAEPEEGQSPRSSSLGLGARLRRAAFAVVSGIPVQAQEKVPEPEVSNPAIRKIIDARAQRLRAINGFKAGGVVGENNEALLELRALDAVSDLRQRAELQRLVKQENADRENLFREIAVFTAVDPSEIPRIRQTYAATLREEANRGDWIQMPDASWRQK